MKLQGKVAVITGGSSGIGLETAKTFVREGAYVFVTGRCQTELKKVETLLKHNVTAVQGDVSKLGDLDRLFKKVADEKGIIDILVANAGCVKRVPLDKASPEHFDKTFGINARGVFFTVQKALPLMKWGGSIVLISSYLHSKGLSEDSTYAATKAAIRSFARTWAAELKDREIRVNTVSPGAIETSMIDGQFKKANQATAFFCSVTALERPE